MSRTPLKHVGIIMDGNGRWARNKGFLRPVGHTHGATTSRQIIDAAIKHHISTLTLYVFSLENWNRPKTEVSLLMKLLVEFIKKEIRTLNERNVRVLALGDLSLLPEKVRTVVDNAMNDTANNTGMVLQLALSYSGREEILVAARKFADQCAKGLCTPDMLTEKMFAGLLYNPQAHEPELIIRTGGEQRLSNFLLWQSAYSEFYFTETLWPDFNEAELVKALDDYYNRERRFGKVLTE